MPLDDRLWYTEDDQCFPLTDARTRTLATKLSFNTRLQEITLFLRHVRDEAAVQALIESLQRAPRLRKVTLMGDKNVAPNRHIDHVLTSLADNRTIQELVLGSLHFSEHALAKVLQETRTLNALCFKNCGLHPLINSRFQEYLGETFVSSGGTLRRLVIEGGNEQTVSAIFHSASRLPSLERLVAKHLTFSDALASSLKEFLASDETRIRVMEFFNCYLFPNPAALIAAGLCANCRLTALCFKECIFDHHAIHELGGAFHVNRSLVRLEIIGCSIFGDTQCFLHGGNDEIPTFRCDCTTYAPIPGATIKEIVPIFHNMKSNDVSRQQIGVPAETKRGILAEELRSNCTLVWLDLTGCFLGDMGCAELAYSLTQDRNLSVLKVQFNYLRDAELCAITQALSCGNSSLRHLHLDSNQFSPCAIASLCTALESNQIMLETLALEGCGLRDEAHVALFHMLGTNTHLRSLYLGDSTKVVMSFYSFFVPKKNSLGDKTDAVRAVLGNIPNICALKALSLCFRESPLMHALRDDIVESFRHNLTLQDVRFHPEDFFEDSQNALMKYYMLRNKNAYLLNDPMPAQVPISLWPHIFAANFRHATSNGDGCSVVFSCLHSIHYDIPLCKH